MKAIHSRLSQFLDGLLVVFLVCIGALFLFVYLGAYGFISTSSGVYPFPY